MIPFEHIPLELRVYREKNINDLVFSIALSFLPDYETALRSGYGSVPSTSDSVEQSAKTLRQTLTTDKCITQYPLLSTVLCDFTDLPIILRCAMRLLLKLVFFWQGYPAGTTPSVMRTAAHAIRMIVRGKHQPILPSPAQDLQIPELDRWLISLLHDNNGPFLQTKLGIELYKIWSYLEHQREAVTRQRHTTPYLNLIASSHRQRAQAQYLVDDFDELAPAERANNLSHEVAKKLIRFLLEKLSVPCPILVNSAAYLLALLFAGIVLPSRPQGQQIAPENLIKRGLIELKEQSLVQHHHIELPSGQFASASGLNNTFSIQLDINWAVSLDSTKIESAVVRRLCSEFNQRYQFRVSESVIARYQSNVLTENGVDQLSIGFLAGTSPKKIAAMHYVAIPMAQVSATKNMYLRHLANMLPDNHQISGCSVLQGWVGSTQLPENTSWVRDLFQLIQCPSAKHALSRHNRITLQTLLVLQIATCYRPVKSQFERQEDFGYDFKTLRINDKDNGEEFRQVVLADVALQQLLRYRQYLTQLTTFRSTAIHLSAAAAGALESTEDLFFFDEKQRVTPITPTAIRQRINLLIDSAKSRQLHKTFQRLEFFITAPDNWYRHLVATHFYSLIWQHRIAESDFLHFFGHLEKPLSSDGTDMQRIAKEMDLLLKSFRIKMVARND